MKNTIAVFAIVLIIFLHFKYRIESEKHNKENVNELKYQIAIRDSVNFYNQKRITEDSIMIITMRKHCR